MDNQTVMAVQSLLESQNVQDTLQGYFISLLFGSFGHLGKKEQILLFQITFYIMYCTIGWPFIHKLTHISIWGNSMRK